MNFINFILSILLCINATAQLYANNVNVKGNNGRTARSTHSSSLLVLTPSTPSITHFVNDSFIIFCRTVQRDINAKWKDPTGTVRENSKGRVHVERKAPGSLALVFEHISLNDKGNWTCEAVLDDANMLPKTETSSDPMTTLARAAQLTRKSFELLVNQKISFDRTELVQSKREGRDATVSCSVQGDPVPDISWLYNGEYINTSNSTKYKRLSDGLFIKNVTQADAGEYTCRAMRITPTFSDSDQVTILLRIQHKPHWIHNETSLIEYAYIGGMVNISCDAMGEPPPSFMWVHEGKALLKPNYQVFYADYGSTLQIYVQNVTQFGDYKCKVANPLGILERIFQLRQGQKPPTPSRFQTKRLFSDGFEFDIRSVEYSNVGDTMRVFGYRVEYMSENDLKYFAGNWSYAQRKEFFFQSGIRFVLTGLERNTTYLMRAASRNIAGLSDWSSVKTFTTLANLACHAIEMLTWKTTLVILLGYIVNVKRQSF